jgi:hypothetical protein
MNMGCLKGYVGGRGEEQFGLKGRITNLVRFSTVERRIGASAFQYIGLVQIFVPSPAPIHLLPVVLQISRKAVDGFQKTLNMWCLVALEVDLCLHVAEIDSLPVHVGNVCCQQ